MAEFTFIDTAAAVEDLAAKLVLEKIVAVDTEADSFFHYYDKLCLVQFSASCGTFLVDPLALPKEGLAPLAPVFANPKIRVVFHAAEYDLFVLHRHSSLRVANLFDTMISAQLLGYPAVGLQALVERHFGVKLSKDQQRTDWSRRPLEHDQLDYAASDVHYLVEVSHILERELAARGRLSWAEAEFQSLTARQWPEREFDELGYLRIKGARKLGARGLAILRELFFVRDKRAREADKPPFKILGNGTLLELAQSPPSSRRALTGRKGVSDIVLRRLGQEILDAVRRGTEGPEHPPLERKSAGNGRRRLDRRGEARLEELKRWRATRSRELELDPGVFCPNASLEEIASALPNDVAELRTLPALKSWWVEGFAEEVLHVLHEAPSEPAQTEPAPSGEVPDPPSSSEEAPRQRARGRRRGSRGGRRRRGVV